MIAQVSLECKFKNTFFALIFFAPILMELIESAPHNWGKLFKRHVLIKDVPRN